MQFKKGAAFAASAEPTLIEIQVCRTDIVAGRLESVNYACCHLRFSVSNNRVWLNIIYQLIKPFCVFVLNIC